MTIISNKNNIILFLLNYYTNQITFIVNTDLMNHKENIGLISTYYHKYIKSNFQIIIFQKDLVESHAQQIVYLLTRFTAPLAVRGGKNSREYQGSPD